MVLSMAAACGQVDSRADAGGNGGAGTGGSSGVGGATMTGGHGGSGTGGVAGAGGHVGAGGGAAGAGGGAAGAGGGAAGAGGGAAGAGGSAAGAGGSAAGAGGSAAGAGGSAAGAGGSAAGAGGSAAGAGGSAAGAGGSAAGAGGSAAGAGGGATGAGGSAAGAGGSAAGAGGGACASASGCPGATTACQHPTCNAGACGVAYASPNTVVTDAAGNCHKSVCDGSGNVVSTIDDADVLVDGNSCTSDLCSAGVASNPRLNAGTICSADGAKACDGNGSCNALTFRVVRVGDGQSALSAASTAGFVEERRVDGTLVATLALPTAASGANQPFTLAGTASSEGALALSSSGQFLTAAGYATPPGTASVAATTAATVFRAVARIDIAGNVDTSTSFSTAESGSNPRSAISLDGSGFWLAGAGGVWYGLTTAATQSGTEVLATAPENVRWLEIFGGQLYGSSGSNGFTNVFSIGSGLPVTINQTATPLPGLPTTGASPYGFVLFDLDAAVAGNDTLYLTDDGAGAGVQKWTFDGSTWTPGETLNLSPPVGFRGLAGFASGGTVTLMASTAETGTDRLVMFVDAGVSTPTATVVATSPVNTMFRGVALSPHF